MLKVRYWNSLLLSCCCLFLPFFFQDLLLLLLLFWERERKERERVPKCTWVGEREGKRILKETPHWVQSMIQGSVSWSIRSQPQPKWRVGCSINWATQAPLQFWLLKFKIFTCFHTYLLKLRSLSWPLSLKLHYHDLNSSAFTIKILQHCIKIPKWLMNCWEFWLLKDDFIRNHISKHLFRASK